MEKYFIAQVILKKDNVIHIRKVIKSFDDILDCVEYMHESKLEDFCHIVLAPSGYGWFYRPDGTQFGYCGWMIEMIDNIEETDNYKIH